MRDDEDFRAIREGIKCAAIGPFFCQLEAERIIASNALAMAICDDYPVTELHTLVIPKRHATTFLSYSSLKSVRSTNYWTAFGSK